ncbi:MAG: ABC transporter substrate-binding protein [Desulfovibrio desulfuricans]|nr:ABC transporter substrate-binding protein [Desulfovibrio desulfuricans]
MTMRDLPVAGAKRRVRLALCLLLFCCLCALPAAARPPLRVIYVEAGPLDAYQQILHGMAQSLHQAGQLTAQPPVMTGKNRSLTLWRWLGEHAGPDLRFLQDGFYSAEWDDNALQEVRQAVQRRLETRRDVDAVLVGGTRAGKLMATLPTDVPVIVTGATDAVGAGIVRSVADSGKNNLVALVYPWRYRRQVEFFRTLFPFRRLGVVYEDTPTGRNVVALKEIESAAERLGVELVRCRTSLHDNDADKVADNVAACHRKLVEQQADAVYLTVSVAMTPEQTRRTLEPLIDAGLPTFAQSGINMVKCGALLSFVDDSVEEGHAAARLLLGVLDGILPRAMSQKFHGARLLAINLRTATYLGWNPSLEVLLSVDEFYE